MDSNTEPSIHVASGAANTLLDRLAAGSVRLVNTSPRYLDLVDYTTGRWRDDRESVLDYADEHLRTCAGLERVLAADAAVAIEVDDYRVPREGRLVLLPDLWAQMLEAVGLRIAERITLVRTLAIGRRSGHFKRYRGAAGYFLPDNVTSTVLVAFKGDPLARIRRDATDADRIDTAWAERFLRTMWQIAPPDARREPDHPVPQDAAVARAFVTFYSLPGDCVLDPFAGSGTTGAVARELGRAAILFDRVGAYVERMRRQLGAVALEERGRPTQVAGAQLWLEFDALTEAACRRAFLERTSLGEVSPRLQEMAQRASAEIGVRIPPELMAVAMRVERWRYREQGAA